jgi:predicted heme/steroid binding protein
MLSCVAHASQGPLGPSDWRYDSLDRLSQAGLLSGHPKGPLSSWATNLTRFEAASLTLRAVQAVGEAYEAQGRSFVRIAQATEGEILPPVDEPEGVVQVEQTPSLEAAQGLTTENLAVVQKLVEEFRTELVEMGARVEYVETGLKDVQSRLGKVEADQKKHKLDGYFQVRYSDDDATDTSEFLVRRARFNIRGPVSDRVSYRIELQMDAKEKGGGPTSKTQLRTLNADYKLDKGYLRIGQAKVPWGYELLESVPDLWTAERCLFMDRLFPNQRDIGVMYAYQAAATKPEFDFGIYNGTGINASDNNKTKNVMARVNFPVRNGSVALSGYTGKNGADASQTDQDRYGASARFKWPGGAHFMAEFVMGRDLGSDIRGYYAQIGHPLAKTRPDLLFAKYDQYDEDTDASDNLFKRWSLGYWYELDPATRLTFVYEIRNPQDNFSELSKWDGNAYYLQLQVKY